VAAARLVFAPSGLIAAGAGVGIGELAGLPLAATVTLAAFGWLVRFTGAVWVRWWRHLPLVTIDPIAVAEPWRSLVRDALGAQQRFDEIVAQWPDGPLHERLIDARGAIHGATDEVWRVAKLGSHMAAPDVYAPEELSRRMRAIQRHPAPVTPGSGGFDEEAALAQQLQAIHRRRETTTRVETHVRRVVTQLNVAVTDLAGLALGADATLSAFDTIDRLSGELQSLHLAIGEISS
jgi:hypothetical protein